MTTSLLSPVLRARRRVYRERQYDIEDALFLPAVKSCSSKLAETLRKRKSCRELGGPLTPAELGPLLDLAVRARGALGHKGERPQILSRPYPSAGGIYEIDLFVCGLVGHEDALFVYDPVYHALASLRGVSRGVVKLIRRDVERLVPGAATVLWGVADVGALSAKYRHHESLLWRNSGSLWASLSLAVTALGYVGCVIGVHEPKGLGGVLASYASKAGVGGMVVAPRKARRGLA